MKNLLSIIKMPRITEKSGIKSESQNAYTFEVHEKSTKKEIAKAFQAVYKIVPVKINITNLPRKVVFKRGKVGVKKSVKKAVVFLKKGDKIAYI